MKNLLPLFIFLITASVFAQKTEIPAEKSKIPTIRWQSGAANSDSIFLDGQELKTIYSERLSISATLIEKKGYIPHAYLIIENISDERILIDPSKWILNAITPKPKPMASKDPDKLADSLENRGKWAAAINSATASMATKETTATVQNPNGTTTTATITERDTDAANRAARENASRQESLNSVADNVRQKSIRVNTLFPKSSISGIVWFEDKKYKEAVLVIVIDGTAYEFPFTRK